MTADDQVVHAITAYAKAGLDPQEIAEDLRLIVGWRVWHGKIRLRSYFTGATWFPGKAFVASCMFCRQHAAPDADCRCGVYATKAINVLIADLPDAWVGPVALWGTVIEHEFGYRASRAYPLGLARADAVPPRDPILISLPVVARAWGRWFGQVRRKATVNSPTQLEPFAHQLAREYGVPVVTEGYQSK